MNSGPATGRGVNVYALVATGAGALLLAIAAAWLLSPEQGFPAPDLTAAARVIADRFSPGELQEAEDYRSFSRIIALAFLAVQFSLLVFLAFWRGEHAKRLLGIANARPLLGALAAGATISLLLSVLRLPFDLASWKLGSEYGLISQALGPKLVDWLLAALIAMVPAAIGALAVMALWRWLGSRFWIAASVLVAVWAVVTTWLWPVVISPLFNDFRVLPDGPARQEVIRLADRAGVDVGEVYVVDASRRSSTLNAYVNGIGSSKRVVIYDNSIRELNRAEFSALVAHELGHVEAHDLRRGLAFALLVIPLGVLFVQLATVAIMRRNGDDRKGAALIPVIALTGEARGLTDLQVRLAKSNLSDVDPPAIWQLLFGTHPTTVDRIAIAEGDR